MSDNYQTLLQKRAELQRQAAELDRQLQAAQAARKEEGIAKLQALITEYGLGIADITAAFPKAVIRTPKIKLHGSVGAKVEPKYRNHATGETWSGRGLQPKWLKAAIQAGKSLDEFKIP